MSRLALAAIVFSCLTTAFCGSAQKVPLFRQRMAERVHVDLTMLDSLVKQDHVLQGRYADELETANRTYEKLSLSNNLEAVVALTNGLEKYHAEAVFIHHAGNITVTQGLQEHFHKAE